MSTTITPFTPEELIEAHIPTVEDRILDIEQAAVVIQQLAVAQLEGSLMLDRAEAIIAACRAIEGALSVKESHGYCHPANFMRAPNVAEGGVQ
jgi:hypothetical protein